MPFWRRKTLPDVLPPAALVPVARPMIADPEAFAELARLDAFAALEPKSFDWNHYMAMVGGAGAPMFAGEFNLIPTMRVIKATLMTEPWMSACTRAISRQFQSCRFELRLRTKADGSKVQVITRHPLLDFLHSAGKEIEDNSAFHSNIVADLVLPGNGYWWMSEDLKDKRRLPAERVDPVIRDNKIQAYRIIEKGEIGLPGDAASRVELSPEEVVHIKLPNPFSPHIGLSMVIATMLPMLIDKYGREYVVGFFLRGGTTAGVIETNTSNVEQLMRLARTLMQAFGGRKNMHADKVLPNGATWKGQGSSFGDIRLVELLKDNVGHFRAATGCTNTVLGIVDNITYATAKAEMELFWKSTILPLQGLYCAGVKASSLWDRCGLDDNYELAIDNSKVEWLDDFDRRLDQDAKLATVATVNERRERLALPSIDRFSDKLAGELVKPAGVPGAPAPTDPAAADPAAPPTAAADNAVTDAKTSLNGAQVTAIIDVVSQVATGKLPRASGVAILQIAFALSPEDAEAIMGDVGQGFEPTPDAPPPANPPPDNTPPDNPPPPPPPTKMLPIGGDELVRWKANELSFQDPPPAIYALFKNEFQVWQEIILKNLEHRTIAGSAIMKRADDFARSFAGEATVSAMRAYDHQMKRAKAAAKSLPLRLASGERAGHVTKESKADRKAKLDSLRERAAQVISQGIFQSGRRGFVGYSDTAMNSIYGFIQDELAAGKSLADVASGVRTRFAESYGTEEAYKGQAETIVRTEYASAVSIGQAKFGEDLGTVSERMSKSWVTMDDEHVREEHLGAEDESPIEGTPDEVNAKVFESTGLRYPREAGGAPGMVINCRCSLIFEVLDWKD